MSEDLKSIERRWRATKWVLEWTKLPTERREKVASEFEETARQLHDHDPELSSDILAALDCLDAVGLSFQRDILEQVGDDVEALVTRLQKTKGW